MVNNQEQMTIFELKIYLEGLKPPQDEDLQNIRNIIPNWDDLNKVTDDDILHVKRILGIPKYYICAPVINIQDCIAIREYEDQQIQILLFINVDSGQRATIHQRF